MKRFLKNLTAILLIITLLMSSASALTVDQALELLESDYYFDIPTEAYEAADIQGLISVLGDPYTYYMDANAYQTFLDSVEDTVDLVGIGVSIQYMPEGILIMEALGGGSAQEAGLQPGDLIVAIDGVSCVPANESHRPLILGEEGSEVTITVSRNGITTDYVLTRCHVVIPNTEFEILDNHIGYIDCRSFGSDTGNLFLNGIETHNESVDCWLVDLRANSGGYSDAAVNALGALAGPGARLYLETNGGWLYYHGYFSEASSDHPVIVLVDEFTASASEAFAAGVRDLRAGISVGSRTYGKGVAQIIRNIETDPEYFADGDALKLTAYRFYSSGGVTNDRVGVIPTLLVDNGIAENVALALCGSTRSGLENQLVLQLNDTLFAVDLETTAPEVLSALFEALPPTARLWIDEEGTPVDYTVLGAAQRLGITYHSRWFSDVAGSPFARAINALATYDVLRGDENGNFCPDKPLTRAEVCSVIAEALALKNSDKQYFSDVSVDDPYTACISAMAAAGLVCGMGDGTFRPDKELTRQEYYTMLGRVLSYLNMNYSFIANTMPRERLNEMSAMGFHSWACEGAALMNMANALYSSSGVITPTDAILREEAAATLYAVLLTAGVL